MTQASYYLMAFYFGGACAIIGVVATTWNKPESTQAEKDAVKAVPLAAMFLVIAGVVFFWPALVLWLVADLATTKREKP